MANDRTQFVVKLLQQIKQATIAEAKIYASRSDFAFVEFGPNLSPAKDGRVTEITMISDALDLTLGVYTPANTAKELYSPIVKKPPDQIPDALAVDFIQEYCNRSVGVIKRMFVDSGVFKKSNLFQTELPANSEQTSGMELAKLVQAGTLDGYWAFKSQSNEIVCWTKIREKSQDIVSNLHTITFVQASSNEGDVDFL